MAHARSPGAQVGSGRARRRGAASAERKEASMNQERRTWPRSEARLSLFVVSSDGGAPVAYEARNLCAGGMLMSAGPAISAGRDLKLMLPLCGRELVLHARVLRVEKDAGGVPRAAIGFRAVPTFVQDLIQEHVLKLLERSPAPAAPPASDPFGPVDWETDQGSTPLRYASHSESTTSAGSPRKASA
jgi:hypothetical protein